MQVLAQAAATGMTDVQQAGADIVNTLDLDEASSPSEREASCPINNGSLTSRASHVARIPRHAIHTSDTITCIRSDNGPAGGSPAVDTVCADGGCAEGTNHGSNRSEIYDGVRNDKRG